MVRGALAPIVDEVAQAYQGKVKIGKMDVDKNASTPQRYGVRGIPTLLIFHGGKVVDTMVGLASEKELRSKLDKLTTASGTLPNRKPSS